MNKIFLNYLIYTCIVLVCGYHTASAQQHSVVLSPAVIDVRVTSGASHTQNFTVTNGTGTRLSYKISVSDFWYDEQNKRLNGATGTLPRSASTWVRFSPTEGFIEPNGSTTVQAVIDIPEWAKGSYYTVPNFEVKTAAQEMSGEQEAKNNLSADLIEVGFRGLMMLTTGDKSEYNFEIKSGIISSSTASSEMEMQLDMHNRGDAHARVQGAFAILNEAGAVVAQGNIKEKRYLPGQRSVLKSGCAGKLTLGQYTCVVTLNYNRVGADSVAVVHKLPLNIK